MVNVAAQSCDIKAVKPANLTSDGGVLNNGTRDVTIECRCMNRKNKLINGIKWFFQNGSQVLNISSVPTDAPYLMTRNNERVAILIIPLFNDTYKGNYTCGKGKSLPIGSPNTTIQLLPGKSFISMDLFFKYTDIAMYIN